MKKIFIYLGITFFLTWLIWGVLSQNVDSLTNSLIAQGVVAVTMWFPAFGLFITKSLSKKDPVVIKPLFIPCIKGNVKTYLAALLLPVLLTIIGAALFFLLFPDRFGMAFEKIARQMRDNGIQLSDNLILLIIIAQMLAAIIFAPFLNMLFALGEELGWRGFLFPELKKKTSSVKAIFASGIIWGVWHAPITAMGHNFGFGYPGFPWTGILAMIIFCTFTGAFLAYITEKTASIWPAALCHGAINAVAGIPILFLNDGFTESGLTSPKLLGPSLPGFISGIPVIILGIWCIIKFKQENPLDKIPALDN